MFPADENVSWARVGPYRCSDAILVVTVNTVIECRLGKGFGKGQDSQVWSLLITVYLVSVYWVRQPAPCY